MCLCQGQTWYRFNDAKSKTDPNSQSLLGSGSLLDCLGQIDLRLAPICLKHGSRSEEMCKYSSWVCIKHRCRRHGEGRTRGLLCWSFKTVWPRFYVITTFLILMLQRWQIEPDVTGHSCNTGGGTSWRRALRKCTTCF